MNTKHTPGPWGIEDNGHEMRKEMIVSRARGNTCIALTFALVGDEERKANARLIAAAPTMYNYLTELALGGNDKAREIISSIHPS